VKIPIRCIFVEFTNYCNLKCRDCASHSFKRKGFINLELFKKIVDEVASFDIPDIAFTIYLDGEALLHPQFKELIYLIKNHKLNKQLPKLNFSTNATLLTKDLADFILTSGRFSFINFSIDAIREETYRYIKRRGNFKRVMENISYIIRKRHELKLMSPIFIFQIIVRKETRHEIKRFIRFWRKKMNMVLPVTTELSETDFTKGTDLIYLKGFISRTGPDNMGLVFNSRLPPCANIFTLSISFDGKVSACCCDTDFELYIGNLNKASLFEIWTSKKAHELRMIHLNGEKHKITHCKDCNEVKGYKPITNSKFIKRYLDFMRSMEKL